MLYLFTNIFVTTSLQDINNKYSGWSIYFQENNISFKDISIIISTDVNVQYIYDNKNNYSDILLGWNTDVSTVQIETLNMSYNNIINNHKNIFLNMSDIENKVSFYFYKYSFHDNITLYLDNINITLYKQNLSNVPMNQTIIINKYYSSNALISQPQEIYDSEFFKYFDIFRVDEYLIPVIYITWWISMLIYSFLGESKGQIMIRLGNWITLNLASILFPIIRNSMWTILFNISHEKISYLHRILAVLCVISVIIKFVTVMILYEPVFLIKIINPSTGGSPLMGTIASLLFILCGFLSIPIIRKRYFEIFYYSHRILSLLIIIASSLHYMSFFYYILPSMILYIIDLATRIYYTNTSIYSKLQNIGLKKYGTSSTFINITFLKKINTFPGCYFFICFYKDISKFEWHPLSMVSYSKDTIVFCAKNVGNHSWTDRLFNIVDNKLDILANKKIYIQGPYGHISINYKNDKYENIIIVAGGIGITAMISILQDINKLYKTKNLHKIKKVHFYWIISHISLYEAFKKYFTNLSTGIFELKIYTTKKINIQDEFNLDYYSTIDNNNLSTKIINEKPNMTFILNKMFSKNMKDVVVLTCGPSKLTSEITEVCNLFDVDISTEVF